MCDHGKNIWQVVKGNAIGIEASKVASVRIHQRDGTYLNCVIVD